MPFRSACLHALLAFLPVLPTAQSPSLPPRSLSSGGVPPSEWSATPYRPPLRCYDPQQNPGVELIRSLFPVTPHPDINTVMMARILMALATNSVNTGNPVRHWTRHHRWVDAGANWRVSFQFAMGRCMLQVYKFDNPDARLNRRVTKPSWDDYFPLSDIVDQARSILVMCRRPWHADADVVPSVGYGGQIAVGNAEGYGVRVFCGALNDDANLVGASSPPNVTVIGQKRPTYTQHSKVVRTTY